MSQSNELSLLFRALKFSAKKHSLQRRKDYQTPYINHPIEVAEMLVRVGQVSDTRILAAAILHDTVEDTDTTPDELRDEFGAEVTELVLECTDDRLLPKQRRKELQVEHASHKSPGAKQIKIADKISNITDLTFTPPPDWTLERRMEYLDWAERVVAGLRGVNSVLDQFFDERLQQARLHLEREREGQASSTAKK